jgi:hypothetical protein
VVVGAVVAIKEAAAAERALLLLELPLELLDLREQMLLALDLRLVLRLLPLLFLLVARLSRPPRQLWNLERTQRPRLNGRRVLRERGRLRERADAAQEGRRDAPVQVRRLEVAAARGQIGLVEDRVELGARALGLVAREHEGIADRVRRSAPLCRAQQRRDALHRARSLRPALRGLR